MGNRAASNCRERVEEREAEKKRIYKEGEEAFKGRKVPLNRGLCN